ncbi:hypothetical protein [Jatrophihabitans fulvus]
MTGPAPRTRLRGRVALRVAALLGVLGVALCVIGVVLVVNAPLLNTGDFARISANGAPQTVRLDRGDYIAYLETPVDGRHDADLGALAVDGPGGPVDATRYDGTLTYAIDGRNGDAQYTFTIERSGDYDIAIRADNAPPGTTMSFGQNVDEGIIAGVLTFAPGLVLVFGAVALLVVGLVRRSRHKRELASAYRGGGNGYFSGPPQPGYGAPPPGSGSPR